MPVDMAKGEHRAETYLELNPTGQVPALMFPEGMVIGESAAIVLVLGERHPESRLIPAPNSDSRAFFLRWLIYMACSPYMTFVQFSHPERFTSDVRARPGVLENARAKLLAQFSLLNDVISGDPFFLKEGLSALDFYLFMLVQFFPDRDELLVEHVKLASLHDAVLQRPCVPAVLSRHREA